MLGETANLRTNKIPYFQIFIVFDKVPYFKSNGNFLKYDIITKHNIDKYIKLSNDDPNIYFHIPNKTLLVLLNLKENKNNTKFISFVDYADYYFENINDKHLITYSNNVLDGFGNHIILNNYEDFIKRMCAFIVSQLKD